MKTWHLVVIGVGVIVLAALILVRVLVFQSYRTPARSMYPTIPQGSYLIVNKLGFGLSSNWGGGGAERGDIVVFTAVSENQEMNYVSRVVALPGDRIEYHNHQMTLNGAAVPVVGDSTRDADGFQLATEQLGPRKIHLSFLPERPGRDFELDVPENEYVVFGDSRDNARDSRYIGTVSKERIVGRVVRIMQLGL